MSIREAFSRTIDTSRVSILGDPWVNFQLSDPLFIAGTGTITIIGKYIFLNHVIVAPDVDLKLMPTNGEIFIEPGFLIAKSIAAKCMEYKLTRIVRDLKPSSKEHTRWRYRPPSKLPFCRWEKVLNANYLLGKCELSAYAKDELSLRQQAKRVDTFLHEHKTSIERLLETNPNLSVVGIL